MYRVLRAIGAFSSFLFLLGAAEARAQDVDAQALALYESGVSAYEEGRYEEAVEAFRAAHDLSPRPLLLYNLANAHERLGHQVEAVAALEAYLPDSEIGERAQLETRIRNLRRRVEEEEAADPRIAPEGSLVGSEGTGGTTGEPADLSGLMTPGVILVGGGVALVAAGIVFGILALDARGQVTGGDDPLCSDTPDGRLLCSGEAGARISDDELFALIADIGLIGGGALAATGLALVILAVSSPGANEETAAWMPDVRVGPNGASAGVVGRF